MAPFFLPDAATFKGYQTESDNDFKGFMMLAFLKGVGLILLIFVAAVSVTAIDATAGKYFSIFILVASAVAIFKPIPRLMLGHRGVSLAVLLFVGIPATVASIGISSEAYEAELAALRDTDVAAYLVALQNTDQTRWLNELAIIDPEQHEIESTRISQEEADRRLVAQQRAESEAAATRARECGRTNEVTAFVMSHEFVRRQLRAPATAQFPSIREATSRAIGDCRYQVISHVDAQNGFGALIRSRYSATMVLFPESRQWSALDVNIAN